MSVLFPLLIRKKRYEPVAECCWEEKGENDFHKEVLNTPLPYKEQKLRREMKLNSKTWSAQHHELYITEYLFFMKYIKTYLWPFDLSEAITGCSFLPLCRSATSEHSFTTKGWAGPEQTFFFALLEELCTHFRIFLSILWLSVSFYVAIVFFLFSTFELVYCSPRELF